MMPSAIVTILFAGVAQAKAWDTTRLVPHYRSNKQEAMDELGDKLVNVLLSHALKAWILDETESDGTTMAKTPLQTSHGMGALRFPLPRLPRSPLLASHNFPSSHAYREHRERVHDPRSLVSAMAGAPKAKVSALEDPVVPRAHTLANSASLETESSLSSSSLNTNYHPGSTPLEEISADEFLEITNDPSHKPLIVDWESKWCRKCKYLKPKLAQLKEVFPSLRIVTLDVNKAPMRVVQGAGVSKLPTIQVWKQGQSVSEVIGGEDGKMIIDSIRNMVRETTTVHERGEITDPA